MSMTLGLDVGANSIGWTLLDTDDGVVKGVGVRIFPEGVDNFDTKKEKPKMESRRIARGMRRQIARRRARKRQLRALLISAGLLPSDQLMRAELDGLDPYELRRKAIDGSAMDLSQFGRLLIHLNQRRGFKSNRKSDRGRKADDKGLLGEINALAAMIAEANCKTLGAYLAKQHENPHQRIRNQHTRRDMFDNEFELCWKAQQAFHPEVLTEEFKQRIRRIMFFQRKMYWRKSVVGRCELEPRHPRCPRADRLAQRFRLLQEVNNLRYFDANAKEEKALSPEQRKLLLEKLSRIKDMDFEKIRKLLDFPESITFNLERGKRKTLKGMPTDAALAKKEIFGAAWHEFPEEKKNKIVRELIDADDDQLPALAAKIELPPAAVDSLSNVDLPDGYAALSRVALKKLLPYMEQGLLYMTDDATPCALTSAGYLRPDQVRRAALPELPDPPDIANPVVRQALFELRKLVNGIIREYGKPERIHIELARNATMSGEDRQKASKKRQENEDRRNDAADLIREHGFKVSRDGIDRVLLWQEQNGACAYSGNSISITQLLQGEADIDHILPYSRCLDNSMQNKVVAFRALNHEKGNRTPREWLECEPERYDQVLQYVKHLSYPKRKRFAQKELELDQFVERQLNDTRYIAREAARYLRQIVDQPHYVLCPKGTHTAELRRHWGLNTLLRDLPDSPAWNEDNHLRDGEKDRSDHRHHAIDALVVALTDHSRLHVLSRIRRDGGTETTGEILPEPWGNFRQTVIDAISKINVSHRVQRRVSGALHEDMFYGPVRKKNIRGEVEISPGEFVVRKPLESLTPAMIEDIRDEEVRRLVQDRLKAKGTKFGRGVKGKIPATVWTEPLLMIRRSGRRQSRNPSVIKKVRVTKQDNTIQPIRNGSAYVKPGSTHHLCIFEWTEKGKKKRDAVFVTMLEAINRIKRKEQIIQRKHPDRPDAKFVMSLSRGEIVTGLKTPGDLFVFNTAASTSKQMWFVAHTDARKSSEMKTVSVKATTIPASARKVTVDPLGRIRWAND